MIHQSDVNIQPSARFAAPRAMIRGTRQPAGHDEDIESPDARHSTKSVTTKATHQQAAGRNLTSVDTNRTSYNSLHEDRPVRAGKRTAVVPYGSHPTGAGWLGQKGNSATRAPVRRAMQTNQTAPAAYVCVCMLCTHIPIRLSERVLVRV